jgi:subtilisin family serine protease
MSKLRIPVVRHGVGASRPPLCVSGRPGEAWHDGRGKHRRGGRVRGIGSAAAARALLVAVALLVPVVGAASEDSFSFGGKVWHTYQSGGAWYMASASDTYRVRSGRVSAAFDTSFTRAQIESAVRGIPGLSILRGTHFNTYDFEFSPEEDPGRYAVALSRLNGVIESAPAALSIVLDGSPDDSRFSRQWGLHNYHTGGAWGLCGCVVDADIDAPEAWDTETGDTTAVVAIIDGGVALGHPDLEDNLWIDWDEYFGDPGVNDDPSQEDTLRDDIYGWDFWDGDNDPRPASGDTHGTHLAGTVAAKTNNDSGVAGVAGGWGDDGRATGARLMALRAFSGSPYGDLVDDAIDYAVSNGADVINMSFHNCVGIVGLNSAANYAWSHGVLMVAASGNSLQAICMPAAHVKVMAIGATDCHDVKAGYSASGPELNLVAPGGEYCQYDTLSAIYSTTGVGSYAYMCGTSMAAAFVSGAAALARSAYPSITIDETWALLESSTDDTAGWAAPGWEEDYGWGRLNLRTMLDGIDYQPNSYFTYPEASCQVFCPGGDADTFVVSVTIRDGDANPVEGVPASVIWGETTSTTFKVCCSDEDVPDCIINYERVYADAPTDSLGATTITFTAGGGRSGAKSAVYSIPLTQVREYGLKIGGYGELSIYPFRSFDITKDCVVDAADRAAFHTARVQNSKTAADFDCDNDVDTADSLLLAAHVGHECQGSRGGRDVPEPSPAADVLRQNAPNPFNPATTISYQVQSAQTPVRIMVYTVAGRLVRTLVNGLESAGNHEVTWDGRDDDGRGLPSGVYFYRIETPGSSEQRKMVLLR